MNALPFNDQEAALECLKNLSPVGMDYEDWLRVGMALQGVGLPCAIWDNWSQRDPLRYEERLCASKWESFRGSANPVGVGTLVKFCRDQGHEPDIHGGYHDGDPGHELAWDAEIGGGKSARTTPAEQAAGVSLKIVRQEWLEDEPIPDLPAGWDGRRDLTEYLKALFNSGEYVGIVTESWGKTDEAGKVKYMPKAGVWDRTAGDLIERLGKAKDLGAVVGDWDPACGAWIRFNPLDGQGCKDANITEFRFCLVESDHVPVERQHAIYQALELPIAALVHSGGKSLHAIVRIDAGDAKEFRDRVDYLYQVCEKNGLKIDRNNRNPSRLSRLPGATRNGNPQRLVATKIGKATWAEWKDWIEAVKADAQAAEAARPTAPRDMIVLPSNAGTGIKESAKAIYARMAKDGDWFTRARCVVRAVPSQGETVIEVVSADAFRSLVEGLGRVMSWRMQNGEPVLAHAVCSRDTASALLACAEIDRLPALRGVSAAPPIVPDSAAGARVLRHGFNAAEGWLVTGKTKPEIMPTAEAVALLRGLFDEFAFATPADASRAMAGLITPALAWGGWLGGKSPVCIPEANAEQTGKGYMLSIVASVYGERPYLAAKREGGVGSLDETIGQALLAARPMIQLDNLRGRIESQYLEAVLTTPLGGQVAVRVPHRGEVLVDPRNTLFLATSNGLAATRDLAARSLMIRIRKRDGFAFRRYAEGGLLQHVEAHQARYLGAVYSVVTAWARAGRRRSGETRHDFRAWAQTLDVIIADHFGGAPIMDGHREAQERIGNPALGWLREVALAAKSEGAMGGELSASAILELCENVGIDLPGLQKGASEDAAMRHIGKLMRRAFGDDTAESVLVDDIAVQRHQREEYEPISRKTRAIRRYVFTGGG
ncbi:MAG: PriCT-2 domain-containing protein [Lentisphaeria bacterium]|jgi:hypothetical protein|nr:PriCT-2 domain-containing protein [Lentisphaeria bacterium]